MTKCLGKITITKEFLESLLGVPEETEIIGGEWDINRQMLSLVIASNEEVDGYTFETEEGCEAKSADGDEVMTGIDMAATGRVFRLTLDDLIQYQDEEDDEHVEVQPQR